MGSGQGFEGCWIRCFNEGFGDCPPAGLFAQVRECNQSMESCEQMQQMQMHRSQQIGASFGILTTQLCFTEKRTELHASSLSLSGLRHEFVVAYCAEHGRTPLQNHSSSMDRLLQEIDCEGTINDASALLDATVETDGWWDWF
jgi:hypothetical protein